MLNRTAQEKNQYCSHRTSFREFVDLQALPDANQERPLLGKVVTADQRFRCTKAECMLMIFIFGAQQPRSDRDLQVDAILSELSGRNIAIDKLMPPKFHEHSEARRTDEPNRMCLFYFYIHVGETSKYTSLVPIVAMEDPSEHHLDVDFKFILEPPQHLPTNHPNL